MQEQTKEVRYDIYCMFCKHCKLDENEDPCNECLTTPINNTLVPLNFKKEKPFINYILPDGISYTRDYRKSEKWKHFSPSKEDLKNFFTKGNDGDWYEKPWN